MSRAPQEFEADENVECTESLFRSEVVEMRRTRLQGEVVLANARYTYWLICLVGLCSAALIAWLVTGSYARVASVRGVLVSDAGAAEIVALHPGLLTKVLAHEGQSVSKGQVLAEVEIDQEFARGLRPTDEGLVALKAQEVLATEQVKASDDRRKSEEDDLAASLSGSKQQITEIDRQIDLQRQLIASLSRGMLRYKPVADEGFISQTEMDRRQQELLSAKADLIRVEQQRTTVLSEEKRAEAQLRQADAENAAQRASVLSSAQGLRMEEAQIKGERRYVVTAPGDGVVTAVQATVGKTVDPGVPLMTIVPKQTSLHAELYAPTKAVGFIRPGQTVRLLYDAYPYEKFGSFPGEISYVSRAAIDPRQVGAALHFDDPVYKISAVPKQQIIKGYGSELQLQAGMTVSANIILERRSFIGWLLDPIRAVARGQK